MTNYNERLDKILKVYFWPDDVGESETLQATHDAAKQALASLIADEMMELLDRLKAGISADIPSYYDQDGWEVAMKHIQAERNKLKEATNDKLQRKSR